MIPRVPRYFVGTHENLGNRMLSRTVYVVASLCAVVTSAQLVGCGRDCGRGTKESNGECVVVATQCGPGTSLGENNVCTASRTGCGPFTALDPVTRQCVPSDGLCGAGTSYDEANRTCVPTTEVICGPGTVLQSQTCVLAIDPCGPGQVLIGNSCVDGGAIQIVHNAPDPALSVLDIYVNGALIANDAAFRSASAFVPFPAGTQVTVVLAAGNAGSATPVTPAATTTLTVGSGDRIAIIAGGVVDTSQFAPGTPDLALDVITGVLSSADEGTPASQYSFAFYNGAPDIGAVNADAGGNATTGIAYGTLTPYIALPRGISPLTVSSTVITPPRRLQISAVGSPIAAPGGVSGGSALIALTSGFANPAANNNGPALEVVVALPTGGPLYVLDSAAQLQVIHNSPDTDAVDVYVGDTLVAQNLAFRNATPFVPVVGSSASTVRLFAAGAAITDTPLLTATGVTINGASIAIADGNAAAAPSDVDALALHVVTNAKTAATSSSVASVALFNGSPGSQPFAASSYGNALFGATAYGSASAYVDLPPAKLPLDVTSGGTPFRAIQTASDGFFGNLSAGGAWLLFATGDSSQPTQIGFALIPATGGSFAFTGEAARAQLVHAAGLAAAETVDIYVDGFLGVNDLAYTAATSFVAMPVGDATIDVLPSTTGTTFGDALPGSATPLLSLVNPGFAVGASYHVVAIGGTVGELALRSSTAQERGVSPAFSDLRLFNAVSNSTVVFQNEGADTSSEADDTTIGLGVDFGDFSTITFNFTPQAYGIEATNAEQNPFVPRTRGTLDLSGAGGRATLLVAAGYVTPPPSSTGREVQLIAVRPDGSSAPLPALP